MQNNWGLLILLVAAVVIYALVKARRMEKDEDGEDVEAPKGEQPETPGTPSEPETTELPWEVCQQLLSEEPPLEGDQAEFHSPDLAEAEGEPETCIELETEVEPVQESRHSVNIAIRREARRLFRESYWKILPLSAIVVALRVLGRLFQLKGILPDWSFLGFNPLQKLLAALLAPIATLGAAYAAVQFWKREAPRVRTLAFFLKERRFSPALGLMLLQALIVAAPFALIQGAFLLFEKIFGIAANMEWAAQLLVGLAFAALFLSLLATVWFDACCQMMNFQIARAPEHGAMAAFRTGLRTGSRHFGRVLGMTIATGWPLGVVVFAELLGTIWSRSSGVSWINPVLAGLELLLELCYGGFILLSMAGLAEKLLPDEEARRDFAESDPSMAGESDGSA